MHPIDHDQVYYVLSGTGEVRSDGVTQRIEAGTAAFFYQCARVGIRQLGKEPLAIIISDPNRPR